ncbi:MAG TPA: VanZ family protein [Fimbriimonadaceae bacterium]|nr:VanZ family protein [Fimbriimonadaceae bacterium]HRJ33403.1 VanZ family protein [Fimbriimonadaceae bacterium]
MPQRLQLLLLGLTLGIWTWAAGQASLAGASIAWIFVLIAGLCVALLGFRHVPIRVYLLGAYVPLFSFFWLNSLESSPAMVRAIQLMGVAAGVGIVTALIAWLPQPESRKALPWFAVLFAGGMLVAEFSGGSGGPGRWVKFFTETLGFSLEAAENATYAIRKTLHFTFYGLLGVLCSRAVRASGTTEREACLWAMAWPITHGAFDELRQAFTPGRQGTVSDLLLDTAGAATLLYLTYRFQTRRRPEKAG